MKTELLAPAGDIDAAYAAFHYGADAVYLGLSHFSARAEAANFTDQQLKSLTGYAHSLNKKVLVAVNTVVFEEEMPLLLETLQTAADAQADAVIVQDIGVARLIKKYFPSLRLHGSTQMAVHNAAGVAEAKEMGFQRVVLARELTLEEIKDIKRSIQGIELEVFIHGALCYSYSGLCLFSAEYTGRSANRGKCVYPCREAFQIDGLKKHPFSMKDLQQGDNIKELREIGVDALKIEGRKKSPLYVAAVTDYYRSILDGKTDRNLLEKKKNTLRQIFSRPTTTLYLKKRKNTDVVDPDIVGHRGLPLGRIERIVKEGKKRFIRFNPLHPFGRYDGIQIDLPGEEKPYGFSAETIRINNKNLFQAQAGHPADVGLPENAPYLPDGAQIYLSSSSAVKSAYPYEKPKENLFLPSEAIDVSIKIGRDAIHASSFNALTAEVHLSLSPAENRELVEKSIRKAFEKTGETGLHLRNLTIDNPHELFVPASALNELRRKLYEQMTLAVKTRKDEEAKTFISEILLHERPKKASAETKKNYILKTDNLEAVSGLTLSDWEKVSEFCLEISPAFDLNQLPEIDRQKIRFALPTVVRKWEYEPLLIKMESLIKQGFSKFEVGNIWGIHALKDKPVDIGFDWPLYCANLSAAKAFLERGASSFIVSPEMSDPSIIFKTFPKEATAIILQDMPLFVSETCPRASLTGECLKCGGTYSKDISSRYGQFKLIGRNCRHWLLNEKPHLKKNEAERAGAKRMRLDFMHRDSSPEYVLETFRRMISYPP